MKLLTLTVRILVEGGWTVPSAFIENEKGKGYAKSKNSMTVMM